MPFRFNLKNVLPYESRFVDVDGYKMHYLDEGQGPVVLLLHGNPTWCFYYRNLITTLKPHFRVIAPDYIGCGLSDHPRDRHFRARDRINQIQSFIKTLGLERYSLVMHDWGGSIGTAIAIANAPAIDRLVYLNTTLTETETLPLLIKTAASPIIGRFLTKTTKRFLKFTTELGVAKKLPKEIKQGYFYPYRSKRDRTAIWDFVADIPFDDSHPSYSEMFELANGIPKLREKPVQIIWGLRDPCFHREMLNKVAEHFPQAGVLEIPEASHLVLEDEPELTGRAILDFLVGKPVDRFQSGDAQVFAVGSRARTSSLYRNFLEVAETYPRSEAVIRPTFIGDTAHYVQTSFDTLARTVNKYQRGLSELGLARGDKVLMLVPLSADFLALALAVMGRGAIPVFVDPGIGREKLFKCIADLKPEVFIGSPKAQLLRLLKKSLFSNTKFQITASEWVPRGKSLRFLKRFAARPIAPVASTGVAMVAFTSGATGTPKGVVFTDEMIDEQLRIFRETLKLEPGKRDLPLLPIFSLFNVALGVCSVVPPLDPSRPLSVEPWKVLKLLSDLGINYSFGSPTLWNKIAEYAVRTRATLAPLERIFMAGAPVSKETLKLVQSVIGDGEAFTPYGATEALPVTFVSASEILGEPPQITADGLIGTFVGRPVDGVELKIIRTVAGPISDLSQTVELPPLEIGEIIVKGRNVSTEYLLNPTATDGAKITSGDLIWHRMGDVGYLDSKGNLYFCGRKSHIVAVKGENFYTVPVERVFNTHPKVRRSALVSVGGENIGIVIEPHPHFWPEGVAAEEQFAAELREHVQDDQVANRISSIYFHRSFPVDSRHNAKIFRDQLSVWVSSIEEARKAA